MNVWLAPGIPNPTEKWRYVETVEEAVTYMKQHYYNNRFNSIAVVSLPLDSDIVHNFIEAIVEAAPNIEKTPGISYHFTKSYNRDDET